MSTQIRAYNAADRNSCLDAFVSNVPQFFTVGEVSDFESFLNRIELQQRSDLNAGKTHFSVVVHHDRVVGCGGFGDKDGNNIISLAWGLIHKDFQKKGLGKELFLYRLNEIKRLYSNASVVIDTTQFSAPFFERFGFVTKKVTNDYYAAGMHRYGMVRV